MKRLTEDYTLVLQLVEKVACFSNYQAKKKNYSEKEFKYV